LAIFYLVPVGITNQLYFESVHYTLYCKCRLHKCNLRLEKQESQLLSGWADRTIYIQRPASDFGSQKEGDFPESLQSHTRTLW